MFRAPSKFRPKSHRARWERAANTTAVILPQRLSVERAIFLIASVVHHKDANTQQRNQYDGFRL